MEGSKEQKIAFFLFLFLVLVLLSSEKTNTQDKKKESTRSSEWVFLSVLRPSTLTLQSKTIKSKQKARQQNKKLLASKPHFDFFFFFRQIERLSQPVPDFENEPKKDYGLKEGETIKVNLVRK